MAPPDETADVEATEASDASEAPGHLLTPEETPEPSVTCGRPTPSGSTPSTDTPSESDGASEPSEPSRALVLSRGVGSRVNQGMDSVNIISDRRTRRSAHFAASMPANAFHAAFHMGTSIPLHRDSLPSEPRTYRDLRGHLFERHFREAIHVEVQAVERHGTWRPVNRPSAHGRVLPLT